MPFLAAAFLSVQAPKTLTLSLPLATYADFCREMTRATGVRFAAANSLAGRKLTIRCDGQPLADVMRATSECLHIVWRADSDGYLMALSDEERLQAKADTELDRRILVDVIDRCGRIAATPRSGRRQLERDPRLKALSPYECFHASVAALKGSVSRLLRGESLVVSSERESGTMFMGMENRFPGEWYGMDADLPVRYTIRYVAMARRLEIGFVATLKDLRPFKGRQQIDLDGGDAEPGFGPLEVEERAWGAMEKVTIPLVAFRPPAPAGLARCTTLGMHLVALGKAANLPVVAPASRFAVATEPLKPQATVKAYLSELRRASLGLSVVPLGGWRLQGGWLMARPKGWWRLAVHEPSESWLRLLEKAYATRGASMLDAEAMAAARLTQNEEEALDERKAIVADAPLNALRDERFALLGGCQDNHLALRLWNGLSTSERRNALENGTVHAPARFLAERQRASPRGIVNTGGGPLPFPFDQATFEGVPWLYVRPRPWNSGFGDEVDDEIFGGVTTDASNMDHVRQSYAFLNAPSLETQYSFVFAGGREGPTALSVIIRKLR